MQSFPPAEGLGLEQVLCLDVTPGPQLRLQADQSLHAVKPPSTTRAKRVNEKYEHSYKRGHDLHQLTPSNQGATDTFEAR